MAFTVKKVAWAIFGVNLGLFIVVIPTVYKNRGETCQGYYQLWLYLDNLINVLSPFDILIE